MSNYKNTEDNGSLAGALGWTFFLTIAFCPLVILGPFIAGWMGGRKGKNPRTALIGGLIPAVFWMALMMFISQREIKGIVLGPLFILGPVTALAIIGGALLGSNGKPAHWIGVLCLIIGLLLVRPQAKELINLKNMLSPAKGAEQSTAAGKVACPENLKKLYNAVMLYSSSWDDTLPPAGSWQKSLANPSQTFAQPDEMRCPSVGHNGYAMNREVSGKRLSDIKDRGHTPLFYDSAVETPNSNDNFSSLPIPGRHSSRNNVIYMDGHTEQK